MNDNQRQSPNKIDAVALLGPQLVLEIQNQGKTAAMSGRHVNTCPWAKPSDDKT
jgi:hypothetical protein